MVRLILTTMLFLFSSLAHASAEEDLQALLQRDQAPPGVVIEIITGLDDGLEWALPMAQEFIQRLRERFPDLPAAVVTHGAEMFALTRKRQESDSDAHKLTRRLLEAGVTVHVCGTYASWRGLGPEAFPDYVDVAPSGPAEVNKYLDLDWELIVIRRADQPL